MNAQVAKTRTRSSRVKLSEASQEKLLDAVVRESEGVHLTPNALSGRATGIC